MTPKEKEYIQSCLFVVDCFIDTRPILAFQMLKFGKTTLSKKEEEWDRIIDDLSKTLWRWDVPKNLAYEKVRIISNKLGEILKNSTND